MNKEWKLKIENLDLDKVYKEIMNESFDNILNWLEEN